jgi:outer membrane protein assembly factor BamB
MSETPMPEVAPNVVPAGASASPPRGIRVWPGLLFAGLQLAAILLPSYITPATFTQFLAMLYGPLIGAVAIALWLWFGSRARLSDKLLATGVTIAGGLAMLPVVHHSMRLGLFLFALPTATTLLVLGFWGGTVPLTAGRRGLLTVMILLGWAYFGLIRIDGTTGSLQSARAWRWEPSAEDRYVASLAKPAASPVAETTPGSAAEKPAEPAAEVVAEPLVAGEGDWTAFRGATRDSVIRVGEFATNWETAPPKTLWKHPIGPGWSAFTVIGNRLFTQEQRGEEECVVCYDGDSGEEIWAHKDRSRFWEVIAGAGPRGTPTFEGGRLYTMGGNGIVNCLDARTGKQLWEVNVVKLTAATIPEWGLASSPLIVDGRVIVHAGRPTKDGLVALDAETGKTVWSVPAGKHSYSSAHLVEVDGVRQVLIVTDGGLLSVNPTDGKTLWNAEWQLPEGMARVVQPALVGPASVILGTGYGEGSKRFDLTLADGKWTATQKWLSKDLKPYYNDFVIHKGYAYGFDHNIVVCVDLETGKKKWKQGRYGFGQMLLLADRDLLLILGEQGELALVDATPKGYREVTRFQALTGKTWNHPVVAHGRLYLRNAEEAAAYELAPVTATEEKTVAGEKTQANAEPVEAGK